MKYTRVSATEKYICFLSALKHAICKSKFWVVISKFLLHNLNFGGPTSCYFYITKSKTNAKIYFNPSLVRKLKCIILFIFLNVLFIYISVDIKRSGGEGRVLERWE